MDTEPNTHADTAADDFESALRALLLESFAAGTGVEGTWEIAPSSPVVPDWRVTVEKVDGAEPPSDGASFLDE